MDRTIETFAPLFGRILLGGFFVWRAIQTILNLPIVTTFSTPFHLAQPELLLLALASVEFIAGILLVTGVATRAAAACLIIYLSITSTIFFDASSPQLFVANMAVTGGLLYVLTYGSGRFSMSAARTKRRGTFFRWSSRS